MRETSATTQADSASNYARSEEALRIARKNYLNAQKLAPKSKTIAEALKRVS